MPQYQGIWTLPQQSQALTNQQWVTDPYYKNTTLHLQADGTSEGLQNHTFIDSSTNNFFITRNGNTTQGSFSPHCKPDGQWSNYFSSSGFTNSTSALMTTSTTTFTIEAWVYMTAAATNGSNNRVSVLSDGDQSGTTYWGFGVNSSNQISFFWYSGSNNSCTGNTTLSLNKWTHIAISVSSNAIKMFVDGELQTLSGTTTLTNRSGTTYGDTGTAFSIAKNYASVFTGYISNLRFVSGTALYSTTFIPQTTPLTAIPNTVLLTCQSNRFVDNSASAYSLTSVSTPSVQAFAPFAPARQWTPDVVGGSGYFDGTGDYIEVADTTSLEPGTGDFCFETWVYHTSASDGSSFDTYTFQTSGGLFVYRNLSNKIQVDSDGVVAILTSASNVPFNSWAHIAVTRSGTTLRIFINGVVDVSVTNSTNIAGSGSIAYGGRSSGSILDGYMASTRFVKGSPVYTTTFTLPTVPLTAITNTQILLNYTNSGIYDATMNNNLETVGNAQVATIPTKNGSGSMYFSGVSPYSYLKGDKNLGQSVAFGTGDFTVECWVFPTSTTNDSVIMDTRPGANSANYFLFYLWTNSGAQQPTIAWYAPTSYILSTGTVSHGVWTHIAICRANGILRSFKDGILQQAAADTTAYANPGAPYPYIGASYGAGSDSFKGYIDDFRITKGYARYIANFTPPQQALPRQ
jgi:hypothetical protein